MTTILEKEFERFLDKTWPLWRDPKNRGNVLYHKMQKAFLAGFELGSEGPSSATINPGKPINIFKVATAPKQKFNARKALR